MNPKLSKDDQFPIQERHNFNSKLEAQQSAVEKYLSVANRNLGVGNFANVLTRDEDTFCVKVFKPAAISGMEKEELLKEVFVQEKLFSMGVKVPKILGYQYFENKNRYYIYMEKINGFSLDRYIEDRIDMFEKFNADTFWSKVNLQIQKMHSTGVIHGDLNTGNIIIEKETGEPVIIDFGQSRDVKLKEGQELSSIALGEDLAELKKTKSKFDDWYNKSKNLSIDK